MMGHLHDRFWRGELTEDEEDLLLMQDPQLAEQLEVSMYVDGTLEPEKTRELERRLLERPELVRLLEELTTIAVAREAVALPARSAPPSTHAGPSPAEGGEPPPPPEGVDREPLRIARITPRRRARGLFTVAVAAAAAVAVAVGWPVDPARGLSWRVQGPERVEHRSSAGSETHALGSTLTVTAGAGSTRALRVYGPEGEVVAACPGRTGCNSEDAQVRLTLPLDRRGTWHLLFIEGAAALEPASLLERDLARLDPSAQIELVDLRVE